MWVWVPLGVCIEDEGSEVCVNVCVGALGCMH